MRALGFETANLTLGQRCLHACGPPLVGLRDVEQLGFDAILRCRTRSIPEPTPLDHSVHSEDPVGVEGSSALHLVADRHKFARVGEGVYQGLVMVDLRARSNDKIAHASCFIYVGHTVAGVPRRSELLHPQKEPSCGHELRRWDSPGRVGGSRLEERCGTWSRLAYLPGLGETSRLLLSVNVARAPARCRRGQLKRRSCHSVPDSPPPNILRLAVQ